MKSYYYDFRDIFRAPRIALHGKNIIMQMQNLTIAYVGYAILAYAAMWVDGVNLSFAWDVHFIYPIGDIGVVSLWGRLVWLAAFHWFLIWMLRGNLAVSRSAVEEIRGNLFFSAPEARKYVKERKGIMLRAYAGVVAFIGFMVVLGLIAGLIGKIPYVGEISFGLFYAFPYFILSLFTVFVMFLLTTLVLTGPSAVAINGEDTLTALFDSFSTVTSRPLRWSIFTGSSLVIAKVCTFILAYFAYRAFQFTNFTTGVFMGDKGKVVFESAIDMFPMSSPGIKFLTYLYPGSDFGFNLFLLGSYHQTDTVLSVAAHLAMIGISFIILFLFAYFINTVVVGQVIAFIDIRRQTHGEKLAELPDEEMFDNFSQKKKEEEKENERSDPEENDEKNGS